MYKVQTLEGHILSMGENYQMIIIPPHKRYIFIYQIYLADRTSEGL